MDRCCLVFCASKFFFFFSMTNLKPVCAYKDLELIAVHCSPLSPVAKCDPNRMKFGIVRFFNNGDDFTSHTLLENLSVTACIVSSSEGIPQNN